MPGNLYLSDRFFIALGLCSFMAFASYSLPVLFYPSLVLPVLIFTTLVTDLALLFRKKTVSADRKMAGVFSLSDPNIITITITNLSKLNLKIKVVDEMPFQFNKRDFSIHITLNSEKTHTVQYVATPPVRGEYHFGKIHLFIRSRIGFVMKKETNCSERTVAVFPSFMQMGRQELLALNHPSFTKGENKIRKLGQSYEFDQIKAYSPGDDTRHINWKATSTLNEVMINSYEDERSQQVYSIIDKSRVMKMPFNRLTLVDYAVNASLAFSNIVLKKHDKAGLIIFSKNTGSVVKADKGIRHLKKITYALYRERYDYSEADYEMLYATIKRTIPNRSLLFLYTNFDSIHSLERNLLALRLINKNHLLVVIFFENEELEAFSRSEATDLADIYQVTIAKKFILEKNQIARELQKHGILCIKCTPESLSATAINKYLELKSSGII